VTKTLTVRHSENRKVGPVALSTYRTQTSCPTDCPLFANGCYAENSAHGGLGPFGVAERGGRSDLDELRAAIRKLRRGDVVRLNVSGDYLLDDGTPDFEYIEVTNAIPPYVAVLSYSHAWRRLNPAMFQDHTRPNASCETEADVAEALAAGWPVVIVDDGTLPKRVAGRVAVACPYETSGRQCIDCQLCARTKRPSVVVFQAHGARRGTAKRAVQAARSRVPMYSERIPRKQKEAA
jgi:hypothetical protein